MLIYVSPTFPCHVGSYFPVRAWTLESINPFKDKQATFNSFLSVSLIVQV